MVGNSRIGAMNSRHGVSLGSVPSSICVRIKFVIGYLANRLLARFCLFIFSSCRVQSAESRKSTAVGFSFSRSRERGTPWGGGGGGDDSSRDVRYLSVDGVGVDLYWCQKSRGGGRVASVILLV